MLLGGAHTALAQGGVRGTISDEKGEPLSFATIYVREMGTGTTANADGYYAIPLPAGSYQLIFQHLGRRTEVRTVAVKTDMISMDITLQPQEIVLQSVTVDADEEDPAYTIMRKAIARADYHRNVLDSYSATVYIKGSGRLKDYPWLAKKALEKEGIEKDRVYVSESVSEVRFTRPSKFEEKVISIRSDGKDNNTSPNGYIFGSFYQPEIAGTVSPLSPRAFSYYRFEYQGTFTDREYEVNRIKVMPRSKGEDVVDGMLFIVENDWSIHSIDMHTVKMGVDIDMKVMCDPIEDKAWLPVSHQYHIDGKVFGFAFEYDYLATVSKYRINVNPEVYVEKMEVIDEKKEPLVAKQVERRQPQGKKKADTGSLQERLAAGEEITRKELKSVMREYEKEERREQREPEVLSDYSFRYDSAAFKKDSLYWASVRPVPLTVGEIRGYEKTDSISAVERAKEQGDTLKKSRHEGFQLWDLLVGDDYRVGPHSNVRIYFPMPGFNTVEGFNLVYRVAWGTVLQDTNHTRFTVRPVFRYAFSREKLSGYLNLFLRNPKYRLTVNTGRYISQYNPDTPILSVVNTFTTLFLEKNLMKIYERDFADIRYQRIFNPFLAMSANISWSDRRELFNSTNYKLINRKDIEGYTPNRPVHASLSDTAFPSHQAVTGSLSVTARPWLKFRIRNGHKRAVESSSPAFTIEYRTALKDVLGSDVHFDQVEAGVKHGFRTGARGKLDVWLRGGIFPDRGTMYFMDYKHFPGNQTPFSTTDPVGSFRLLDYYRFSTNDRYFMGNLHYQFRRLLVTTIPVTRLAGIRENVFINYLATPQSQNYVEAGYSIDGILRIFRLEAAAAFQDGRYTGYGIRVGVATSVAADFSD